MKTGLKILVTLVFLFGVADSEELVERLRSSVVSLSSVESRVTGYPGHNIVGAWIEGELREMGVSDIYNHIKSNTWHIKLTKRICYIRLYS